MQNKKRARTEAEKTGRKSVIMSAAREMIDESGFDKVTMSGLAKRAGVAKGTLYLYVKTKEELFAALFVEAFETFMESALLHLEDDETLVSGMCFAARDTPLFLALMARLSSVIEVNLPMETLVQVKRCARDQGVRFATGLSEARGIPFEAAYEIAYALFVVLLGAAQSCVDLPEYFEDLPEDVKEVYALSQMDQLFGLTARLVLKGASA